MICLLKCLQSIFFAVFDKCGDGSHNCHDNATCTNTDRDGYFKCECKPGHFGNGTSCQGKQLLFCAQTLSSF